MPMQLLPFNLSAAQTALFGHPGRLTSIILGIVSMIALGAPTLIVTLAPAPQAAAPGLGAKPPVVPPQTLPPVDPVKLAALTPGDARAINEAVPFSEAANPAARPFRLTDQGTDAARAVDCLATAALYEAGDDTTGQRAVAQVIINRVRHPAFPKTICGVVFQGAERRTGCQFTFTCDGALIRHRWSDAAWVRARTIATEALSGKVYAQVGHATHYHTDWVVPYWSSSLDKVSAVGTHLFFRWTGWWGTPPAFNRRVAMNEPAIAQLARYSPAHSSAMGLLGLSAADLPSEPYIAPNPVPGDSNAFLATIDRRADPDSFRKLAEASCGARSYCKYMAWTARFRTPTALPLEPFQVATMSFSYLRDRTRGFDKALWSCGQFPRADRNQCMKTQTFVPGVIAPPSPTESAANVTGAAATSIVGEGEASQGAAAATPRARMRASGNFPPASNATLPAPSVTPAPAR